MHTTVKTWLSLQEDKNLRWTTRTYPWLMLCQGVWIVGLARRPANWHHDMWVTSSRCPQPGQSSKSDPHDSALLIYVTTCATFVKVLRILPRLEDRSSSPNDRQTSTQPLTSLNQHGGWSYSACLLTEVLKISFIITNYHGLHSIGPFLPFLQCSSKASIYLCVTLPSLFRYSIVFHSS